MWCRSWAESRPVTGAAETITNPTVIAVRWSRGISFVRPRGVASKMIAPSIRGIWNVKSPTIKPRIVFGTVQQNPSQVGIGHTLPRRSGGGEGYRDP